MIKAFAATKPFKSLRNAPKKTIAQLALESLRKLTRSPASIFVPGQGYLQTLDNRLTYSQDLSNAAYVLQGGASKSGQNLLMSAAADGLYHSCTIGVGPITLSYTLSGSGRVYVWGYNATDGTIGLTPIDLTATPTVYVVNITPTVANTTWQIGRTASGTASSVTLGACGEHPGTYTAQQIASLGIPWTMGTASVSLSLGPEKVVNGSFDDASNWTKSGAPNNWNITGNVLNGVGSGTFSYIDNLVSYAEFITGTNYWISVDQVFSGSAATLYLRGSSSVNLPATTGRIALALAAGSGATGVRFGSSGFTGTLDNVSVREILSVACPVYTDAHVYLPGSTQVSYGAELWGAPTTFSDGTVTADGLDVVFTASPINVSGGKAATGMTGKTFSVTYTLSGMDGGDQARIILYGSGTVANGATRTANGTYTEELTPSIAGGSFTDQIRCQTVSGGTLRFSAVSVREKITTSSVVSGLSTNNYTLSDGSTGYSAVDGTAGLVLDGEGSVGANVVVNGDFATDTVWGKGPQTTIAGGKATIASTGAASSLSQNSILTAASTYQITFDAVVRSGTAKLEANGGGTYLLIDSTKSYSCLFTGSTNVVFNRLSACDIDIDNVVAREVTGIHATQSTTANKPAVRRGLYNRFLGSNDLANTTYWVRGAGGIGVAPVVTAGHQDPFGGTSAYRVVLDKGVGTTTTDDCRLVGNTLNAAPSDGTTRTMAVWLKSNTASTYTVQIRLHSSPVLASVTPTWTLFTVSGSDSATDGTTAIARLRGASGSSDYADILVYNAGLFAGTLTAAQILNEGGIPTTTSAAASNQSAGRYSWQFDGGTDYLQLGSLPFVLADDFLVVAAVNTHSLTTTQKVFSLRGATANPLIELILNNSGRPVAQVRDDAGVLVDRTHTSALSGMAIVSMWKVGSNAYLRVNGAQSGAVISLSGLGTTSLLYASIGSALPGGTGGASLWFNGAMGPCIPIKGTFTEADVLTLERFVAANAPNGPSF